MNILEQLINNIEFKNIFCSQIDTIPTFFKVLLSKKNILKLLVLMFIVNDDGKLLQTIKIPILTNKKT